MPILHCCCPCDYLGVATKSLRNRLQWNRHLRRCIRVASSRGHIACSSAASYGLSNSVATIAGHGCRSGQAISFLGDPDSNPFRDEVEAPLEGCWIDVFFFSVRRAIKVLLELFGHERKPAVETAKAMTRKIRCYTLQKRYSLQTNTLRKAHFWLILFASGLILSMTLII